MIVHAGGTKRCILDCEDTRIQPISHMCSNGTVWYTIVTFRRFRQVSQLTNCTTIAINAAVSSTLLLEKPHYERTQAAIYCLSLYVTVLKPNTERAHLSSKQPTKPQLSPTLTTRFVNFKHSLKLASLLAVVFAVLCSKTQFKRILLHNSCFVCTSAQQSSDTSHCLKHSRVK